MLLTESIQIAIVGIADVSPGRSAVVLDRVGGLLTRCNRAIMIVLSAVFGPWFLVKALDGLGVLQPPTWSRRSSEGGE